LRKSVSLIPALLLQLLVISLFSQSFKTSANFYQSNSFTTKASQSDGLFFLQPIYLRLQTEEESNVTLWESIPQNLSDHVATIDVNVLAVFVSSNARKIDLYKDAVGNLWLAAAYTLKTGDYIDTLTWVSSKTLTENLTIPDATGFPQDYPDDIKPFLLSGKKIPADDTAIKQIAQSLSSQDMILTVKNVLNFVNKTQSYDREKVITLTNGTLRTSDMLDFINDPSESLRTNLSFCFERALLATTILRAAGVPSRTFTNDDLKSWIQVWLPQTGWVAGEVLCISPHTQPLFPRSLSVSVPRMIQNSSDAIFPFTWLPKTRMRIADLTLTSLEEFDVNKYGTMLCQPTDIEAYESNPERFSFPIVYEPETIQAALTSNNSDLIFHISKGKESISRKLTLGVLNSVEFESLKVSFTPAHQNNTMVALNDFSVQRTQSFDYRIIIPLLIAIPILSIAMFYWRRKGAKTSLHDHGNLISSDKS
jgi:hypothetical protein